MNVLKLDNLFIGCRYSLLTGISFFFLQELALSFLLFVNNYR
jgi:hypothetical protein